MKIEKLESLVAKLRAMAKKSKVTDNVSWVVGYSTNYALFVHEDLEKRHGSVYNEYYAAEIDAGLMHSRGEGQQAKFLEQPARRLNNDGEFSRILKEGKKRGLNLDQCLMMCALRLQRESMELVPVDTGILRASAFAEKRINE
jgi:hypothetical protein